MGNWQQLSSKYVHENRFYKVREDQVLTPDGKEGTYHVIDNDHAAIIIAVTGDNKVYLVKLFRYPIQEWSWELPAGGLEEGEDPLEAAKRELQEETGYQAGHWDYLGITYPASGKMIGSHHIYVANDLRKNGGNQQAEEGITNLQAFTLDEVWQMVADGEITDGTTLAPLMLAMARGKLPK